VSNSDVRASLIVLNYNGATVLQRCLESLTCAMGPQDELIVVDNASPDGSGEIARTFCAAGERRLFIQRAVNNYIFGLNDGLARANGRYVGFLNNDNYFEPSSIDQMLRCFENASTFAVCPRIVREADGFDQGALTSGYWKAGLIFYRVHDHDPRAERTFFAVGGQSLFDRQKLEEIGTIDELLYPMYHEDIELSWRAWKADYEVRYAPDAIVRHVGSHASGSVFTSAELRAFVRQNEFLMVWKNVTDRSLITEHVLLLPARLLVACAKRDWPTLVGFWSALRRLRRVRAARARARGAARVSDRTVLQRVSAEGLAIIGSGQAWVAADRSIRKPSEEALRVLLLSPLQGRDPESGDTSYTSALLADPPPGVSYTTYHDALIAGTLRVRGRKPWRPDPSLTDMWIFAARSIESALRRGSLTFREQFRFLSVDPDSFDLVHQHVFAVRQVGPKVPVVCVAGYPLTELYRTRERWGKLHLRVALAVETALSRVCDVNVPWLRTTSDGVMAVYTEKFRAWLIERGIDGDRIHVTSTALQPLDLPEKRSDGRTLGLIVRDFELKGGDIALAAFRELRASDPAWRLIVGTTLEEAGAYLTPEPGIELVIDPTREMVLSELLPRIDVLLAPTRADCGAPYTAPEALQAGTCVVTSDIAWLDPRLQLPAVARVAADPSAVAAAVVALADQDVRVARLAARELWRREFSTEQLHPLLLKAYAAALDAHERRTAERA